MNCGMQTECQDKTMDTELQQGRSAGARLDEDASAASVAMTAEVSAAHSIVFAVGYMIVTMLSLMALAV